MSGITVDPAAAVVEHFSADNRLGKYEFLLFWARLYVWILVHYDYSINLLCNLVLSEIAKILLSRSMSIIVVASVNIFVPFSNNIANLVWGKEVIAVIITSVVLRYSYVPNFKYVKI